LNEDGPESDEFTNCTGNEVGCKCARFFPVTESDAIVIWAAAEVDGDGENNEANYSDHLDTAEPELQLAEELDGQEVDGCYAEPGYNDAIGDGEIGCPVLDDQTSGSEFEGECHGPGEPVDPAHGETKRGVDEPRCVCSKCTGNGDVRCHLSKRNHDTEDEGTDESVGKQSTCWPRFGNGTTRSNE